MKKSNYIVIAFAVFFFGLITTMYVDAKNAVKENLKQNELILSNQNLDNFSVVVAHKKTKITLTSNTNNKIVESYYKHRDSTESSIPEFNKKCDYEIRNDTLFIKKTYKAKVTIKVNSLKSIITNGKNRISLRKFKMDTLSLNCADTHLDYSGLTLEHFKIKATNNSKIYLNNSKINSFDIDLNNSKITSYSSKSTKTNAILKNNSNLTIQKANILNINSDKTSKYYIYN